MGEIIGEWDEGLKEGRLIAFPAQGCSSIASLLLW